MKSVVTIFLLVPMVLVQTPVGQFLKLPMLIEHFMNHQRRDNVSLIGFLEDHYSPDHADADLPEDQELPFRSITFYSMGYAIVPGIIKPSVSVTLYADKKVTFPESHTGQQHIDNIFHPPKI